MGETVDLKTKSELSQTVFKTPPRFFSLSSFSFLHFQIRIMRENAEETIKTSNIDKDAGRAYSNVYNT